MEEPQMRQRTMVAEVPPPTSSAAVSNLRDLLTVRQEEDLHRPPGTERVPRLSLGAVIAVEKLRSPSAGGTRETSSATNVPAGGRTLLDIIRDEEQSGRRGSDHAIGSSSSSSVQKINWRAFKDRLRIRRASNGGDDRLDNISPSDSPTEDNDPAATVSGNGPSSGEPEAPPQPMRMSLMALLEQTDNQRARPGVPVSALLAEDEDENEEGRPEEEEDDDDDDDEEEEEYCGSGGGGGGGEGGGGKMYVKCCVCMVRHKGAAFIPCGHTFCRLCSRELWISRGNCPLCNGFILEILDIF